MSDWDFEGSAVRGPFRGVYTEDLVQTLDAWTGNLGGPDPLNRARREGIRVLKNPVLEAVLSKAHPISPIIWAGPIMVWGITRGVQQHGGVNTAGLVLLGILLWTLLEYFLHRVVFHLKPSGPSGKMYSFMIHGYHHEFPNDKMRLVAPPYLLLPVGFGIALLFMVLFGNAWLPVLAGTGIGYVAYDWTHYYTHHFHPKKGLGAWLRRYHLKHHFQEGDMRYGISSPLWDLAFGSYLSPDK